MVGPTFSVVPYTPESLFAPKVPVDVSISEASIVIRIHAVEKMDAPQGGGGGKGFGLVSPFGFREMFAAVVMRCKRWCSERRSAGADPRGRCVIRSCASVTREMVSTSCGRSSGVGRVSVGGRWG